MADFTVFSNKNYNSTLWINNTIKEINNEESIESYITSLSTKLHIMSQDYTDQLETAMVESMSIMPRVLSEITKTEEQLKNIETEMKNLSLQLNTFDERNVIGVEDLSRLDMLKTNMEKCKATLEEHARWSQLVREAKILLESGSKLSDSADRIEIMFHSLEILKNLPGHEERQETCETFRNSLLSALRPIVAKDIAGCDIGPLKEYLYVFEKLGRNNELEEQYVSVKPSHIKLYWNDYHIKESTSISFIKWLSLYFNKILKLINEEENNTITLFGKEKSLTIMCAMIYESLQPYATTFQTRLIALQSNSPIIICQSYQLIDDFTKRIIGILKSSNNESQQLKLLDALYLGYHSEVNVYIKYEEMFLSDRLNQLIDIVMFMIPESKNINKNSNAASLDEELFGDGSESSSNSSSDTIYANYCEKLLLICNTFHIIIEETLQRTVSFIGGIAIKSILRTIASYLNVFVKKLILKIDDLTIACGYPSINYYGHNHPPSTNTSTNNLTTATSNENDLNNVISSNNSIVELQSKDRSSQSNAEKLGMKLNTRSDIDHKLLVITALKSLQAIGRFHKQFHHLEVITKQILLSLQQQVFNSMPLFNSLDKYDTNVIDNTNTTTNTSVGVIYSMHVLHTNEDHLNELKSFLVSSTSNSSNIISQSVYSNINPTINKLKSITASLLFNLCIETPEKMISTLSTEDVWCTEIPHENINTDQIKTSMKLIEKLCENLLPQSMISQIGEYMLSLVQELESFASSEALVDLLTLKGESKSLPYLSRGWQKVKNILNITETETLIGLSNRMKCANLIATLETTLLGTSDLALAIAQSGGTLYEDMIVEEESYEPMNNNDFSTTKEEVMIDYSNQVLIFVNEWLSSIFDAIVGFFIVQISEISILTLVGSAQLLTDLEYLSNVCNAMGIRIHPLLTHVKTLLQQEPSSLLTMIESLHTISETNKGSIGYLLKFDLLLVHSIVKGNKL